ncbi:MAG: acriflavin resistance protein [Desulfuromonas sp.]|nr:MAG: acriflavin resistance protein [Desulfuromonas sp.]
MKLPRFSVGRPVFTTMVTLIVVLLGLFSLSRLQIDMLPNIELPTLTIRTQYEGASPVVMERLVTQIVEEIIATVPGVEDISSQSSEGNSTVRVSFAWGTDIDTAALDVQAQLEDEINELPDDVVRPRVSKFDIASFPVVLLGISSNLDPVELTQLVEDQVRYRFGRLPGVAQVDLWGGFNREIRVELDPDRVKALGLPLDQLLQAIRNANLDLPAGKLEQGRFEVTLRAPAEFANLDQIRDTVIYQKDGVSVTLGQVAKVRDTYEKLRRIIRMDGERGLRVAIRKQQEANTVEVSKAILSEIDNFNHAFPQIKITPVINQGNFIQLSIANVARSILYGGFLSIIVLLFFLRNIRSTIVISLAIPISVIATFALIYFGGFTLNLMTLGGLALGVGMMVDSSVVVLENIFRRRSENSESPEIASIEGAREVGNAIVASTITTLVIFLPLIFVRGVAGLLFKELALVIIFALVCSLMVSLSLLPMLASKLLESPEQMRQRRPPWIENLVEKSDRFYDWIDNSYRKLLQAVLNHRLRTVVIAFSLLFSTLLLLPLIGTEFLPPSDEGEVRVTGEMEIGTRLETLDEQARRLEKMVFAAVPEAVASVTSVGSSGWRPSDVSKTQIRISLVPATDRDRSNTEIAKALRRQLEGQIPGMTIRTRAPQGQFLLERILRTEEGINIEIRGFDLDMLDNLANRAVIAITGIPGITDIEKSQQTGIPQQEVEVDRDKVADLGLSVRDVAQVLETAVGGSRAGEFRAEGNSYRIFVQLENAEKRSIEEILDLTLTARSGEQVALRNLVSYQSGRGPILIDRKDRQRLVTVKANIADRDLGSVAADVQAALDQIPRSVGYDLLVAGNFEEQQKAFDELVVSLILALLLVYMVLACQYESLRDPIIVMASVPVAAVGVIIILLLTGTTLNLQSFIGCIMLGGIVVNNAILLVDQAGQLERGGLSVRDAISEAGRRRLRPILMTSLTTILALTPLAIGLGEGADAQAPLARAVVGGLAGSTLITLALIPAVYSLMHRDKTETADA